MFEQLPWGALNFNVLRGLIEGLDILRLGTGAEIGVLDGGTSYYLLNSFPALKLISVDPYKAYHEYDQARMDAAERTAIERLTQFGGRSVRLKVDSVQAAQSFPDESFDFVFIDGDHTYEAVCKDLAAWYPKVRKGGLFSGHDYSWDGVNRAVHEFAKAQALQGRCSPKESDIWWCLR